MKQEGVTLRFQIKNTKSGLKCVYVFSYIMVFIGRRRELRKLENLYYVKESGCFDIDYPFYL